MLFFHKKTPEPIPYDPAVREPAVRRSICTGEATAGFVDRETGRFQDLMLLRDQKELEDFCRRTNVAPGDIRTIY